MTQDLPISKSLVDQVGLPFLARRIHQFHELLAQQGQDYLNARGVDLDSRLASVLFCVGQRPGLSVAQLADELDLSHQLATYRVKKLCDAGLGSQSRDPDDRSRYILCLTERGVEIFRELNAAMDTIQQVYARVFEEIDADLFDIVTRARAALRRRSIADRAEDVSAVETDA